MGNVRLTREEIETYRREEMELRRPFIELIVTAYNRSVPSVLVSADGRILQSIYPQELEQYVGEIRELMQSAVTSARRRRGLLL